MDAEARKAELMKENRMGDSKMFKLDFDPSPVWKSAGWIIQCRNE